MEYLPDNRSVVYLPIGRTKNDLKNAIFKKLMLENINIADKVKTLHFMFH